LVLISSCNPVIKYSSTGFERFNESQVFERLSERIKSGVILDKEEVFKS
jgi:hypothetical protein